MCTVTCTVIHPGRSDTLLGFGGCPSVALTAAVRVGAPVTPCGLAEGPDCGPAEDPGPWCVVKPILQPSPYGWLRTRLCGHVGDCGAATRMARAAGSPQICGIQVRVFRSLSCKCNSWCSRCCRMSAFWPSATSVSCESKTLKIEQQLCSMTEYDGGQKMPWPHTWLISLFREPITDHIGWQDSTFYIFSFPNTFLQALEVEQVSKKEGWMDAAWCSTALLKTKKHSDNCTVFRWIITKVVKAEGFPILTCFPVCFVVFLSICLYCLYWSIGGKKHLQLLEGFVCHLFWWCPVSAITVFVHNAITPHSSCLYNKVMQVLSRQECHYDFCAEGF